MHLQLDLAGYGKFTAFFFFKYDVVLLLAKSKGCGRSSASIKGLLPPTMLWLCVRTYAVNGRKIAMGGGFQRYAFTMHAAVMSKNETTRNNHLTEIKGTFKSVFICTIR